MLIDDVTITVAAGNGGDGAVAFNKNLMELGPTGASGGHGGSVYCEGVADIGALSRWRNTKAATAEPGEQGGMQFRDGKDGADLVFPVPVGTVVHNLDTGEDVEITAIGECILLARGGKGGRGNFHFRSSLNTSPKRFEPGTPGQSFSIRLELKLIADIGLIGMPNAGKSSLLNELTRAQQKVANYPFTTLEPSLGVYYELIIADIPGLIEGAASGKGLGIKFLRHVERTRTLFHLVSCESDDPVRDWSVIRGELGAYSPVMLQKDERVLLTKTDLVDPATVERLCERFREAGVDALPLSIHDIESMARLEAVLRACITAKQAPDHSPIA
ncbi:MAG: GTPase ObgE [Candidatus Yanofskybacteria bacterium]|nr:GTPase ObgE [Candidatus Yanofskybacteria bacterium]